MQSSLEQLQFRFNTLSQREKLMTSAAAIALLWAGWDSLINQAMQHEQQRLHSEILALQTELLTQQQLVQQADLSGISQKNQQQQLTQIRQSVENLKRQLGTGDKKFVPPELMANALRDILKQQGHLKLVKLETLPAAPFAGQDNQPAWVYRHALKLILQGDFFSTLDYLKALETLPWRIHWDSIDYQVDAYPRAETRIQVYTLSFEQDWLGA